MLRLTNPLICSMLFFFYQVTIKPEDYVAIMRYLNSEKVSEEVAQRENLKAALKDFIVEVRST